MSTSWKGERRERLIVSKAQALTGIDFELSIFFNSKPAMCDSDCSLILKLEGAKAGDISPTGKRSATGRPFNLLGNPTPSLPAAGFTNRLLPQPHANLGSFPSPATRYAITPRNASHLAVAYDPLRKYPGIVPMERPLRQRRQMEASDFPPGGAPYGHPVSVYNISGRTIGGRCDTTPVGRLGHLVLPAMGWIEASLRSGEAKDGFSLTVWRSV
ncbi:hypothetical protein N658DRAFT_252752 [Parathielavia hyrcaniae]|uniref:Uncharacterized protein n=1 Tax=Parathielavia hyrcaniae TaxID=113614 RepID=A0AAN6SYW1_9PEZI|nr:hypothetical protein N658DRAFT_252752 [Parathielavia hyrcaniae]